jgi:hypothetical protein
VRRLALAVLAAAAVALGATGCGSGATSTAPPSGGEGLFGPTGGKGEGPESQAGGESEGGEGHGADETSSEARELERARELFEEDEQSGEGAPGPPPKGGEQEMPEVREELKET